MWEQLLPVVLGFALTTVAGGLIARRLQDRSWERQNEARLREQAVQHAGDVCRSVSGLLDRRRYRMQRLLWAIRDDDGSDRAREALTARLQAYDDVLVEWNDQLNSGLAVVETYFGPSLRSRLGETVYPAYRSVGALLETALLAHERGGPAPPGATVAEVQSALDTLDALAYDITSDLTVRIRDEQVGRWASGAGPPPRRPRPPGRASRRRRR
ncbi:hypothetical protein OMK64_01050 [Cellulomonas fimi]|uniref:hypothetical protein n=1 Tax=Cellulomonas fimi TaxID=1708 RepID=UPI00234D760F|nr:hypothetical protein [Cellulomonas fimi]MDC7120120.1 hypothetical protein [Cellulomonas fimi]